MSRKEGWLQDPRKQAKLRDQEALRELQRKSDLEFVMSGPSGRRFMHDLIFDICGLMSVYPGQDSGIYRNEGARNVGFKLAKEIQDTLPDAFVKMIAERQEAIKEFNRLRKAALTDARGDENA